MNKYQFSFVRNFIENFDYNDTPFNQLTESEIQEAGFSNKKELIRHCIKEFLQNKQRIEIYIHNLRHDLLLNGDDPYFAELNRSYRLSIKFLQNFL